MSTILFDVDGVLADFVGAFTRQAKKMNFLKEAISTEDQLNWDGFGMTQKQMNSVWDVILGTEHWWYQLDPLISQPSFRQIQDLTYDHQVVFVSAREGIHPQRDTVNWLTDRGVVTPSVIITKRKGEIARALDADYSLEDKPENAAVIHWMADVKPCKSYIIDRPYNRVDYLPKKIKRVKTVEEFLNEIE